MLEIRRLGPDEAALYREIRLEALRTEPDAFASTYELEQAYPLERFANRLTGSIVLGAFDGAILAGVAGFYIQDKPKHGHKGMLWGMYVRPRYRGTGLSRRLVQGIIDIARQQVEILQLFVISDNEPARRLYRRLGFVEYGIERKATKYQGRYHDDVLMALFFDEAPGPGVKEPPV